MIEYAGIRRFSGEEAVVGAEQGVCRDRDDDIDVQPSEGLDG